MDYSFLNFTNRVPDERNSAFETRMLAMGITPETYNTLCNVADLHQVLICIRKTNPGSALPFATRSATGKPLAVKGKSSDKFFTKGYIAFLARLSKQVDDDFAKQQDTLNAAAEKAITEPSPLYTYTPRFLSEKQLGELGITIPLNNPQSWFLYPQDNLEYLLQQTTFTDLNQAFKLKHHAIYGPDAQGELINPDSSAEQYYQIYVKHNNQDDNYWQARSSVLPSIATTRAISQPIVQTNTDALRAKRLKSQADFAPLHPNQPEYRAVSILSQLKQENNSFLYYEVVADYDVFCICPELDHYSAKIKESFSLDDKKGYQGFISNFERRIKRAINMALRGNPGNNVSSTSDGSGNSKIKFVIHGSEVNNYFYTEDFNSLIVIPPGHKAYTRDVKQGDGYRPKFSLESEGLLTMSKQTSLQEPYNAPKPTWQVQNVEAYQNYCFFFNLRWGNKFYPEEKPLEKVIAYLGNKTGKDLFAAALDANMRNINDKYMRIQRNMTRNISLLTFNYNLLSRHLNRLSIYTYHYSTLHALTKTYDPHDPKKSASLVAGWIKDGFIILVNHIYNFQNTITSLSEQSPLDRGLPDIKEKADTLYNTANTLLKNM